MQGGLPSFVNLVIFMANLIIRNLQGIQIPVTGEGRAALRLIGEAGIDWMHSCGGKGRCTTCKMRVLAGAENLSARSAAELKYFAAGRLRKDERLACQCRITGEVTVEVPPDTQLPHLKYSH
jgi:2Fe-2S ferredoxin